MKSNLNGAITCIATGFDELGTNRYRKYRDRKSPKVGTGTEYIWYGTFGTGIWRVKPLNTGVEPIPKISKIDTNSVLKIYPV